MLTKFPNPWSSFVRIISRILTTDRCLQENILAPMDIPPVISRETREQRFKRLFAAADKGEGELGWRRAAADAAANVDREISDEIHNMLRYLYEDRLNGRSSSDRLTKLKLR